MTTRGRSLELYFVDGRPDGMLTAEVFNWTGHVLRIPRTQIKEGLGRPEAGHTGVYLLIGEAQGTPLAYIGEAENMRERLREHIAKKDWWEQAILISTSADVLHKAHVKYLESRLVEIATKVGGIELENSNVPPQSSLTEAARSNMESFLETLGMVLPAIRVDVFLDKSRPNQSNAIETGSDAAPVFVIFSPRASIKATAVFLNGEMTVKAGSAARPEWVGKGSWDSGYRALREQLTNSGVISKSPDGARFEKDYSFSSPSAAAAVVLGRAANGRTEWKVEASSTTYADWEQLQIAGEEAAK